MFLAASRAGTLSGISRRAPAAIIAVSTLLPGAAFAADALKEIRLGWATCDPVSIVLKQKGSLEKEFARDGISVVWVQSAGSNKALEFLNAGSIDFGSTAGFSAEFKPGEIVAIMGGSGCGTSTLLRAIAGLDRAGTGTIIRKF
jgi:ABC-type nitrate/sulfonate/bicarbonate transport system substrate-binding protein